MLENNTIVIKLLIDYYSKKTIFNLNSYSNKT